MLTVFDFPAAQRPTLRTVKKIQNFDKIRFFLLTFHFEVPMESEEQCALLHKA